METLKDLQRATRSWFLKAKAGTPMWPRMLSTEDWKNTEVTELSISYALFAFSLVCPFVTFASACVRGHMLVGEGYSSHGT